MTKNTKTTLWTEFREDKAELIEQYASAGFALVDLKKEKACYEEGWTKTKPDPTLTIEDFPYNYGVVLRDEHLVVDIDPRNFRNGVNSWQALTLDLLLPMNFDTFTVQTGAKDPGIHIYFKKPKGLKVREILGKGDANPYPGLEFKTKGRQVVGAYSIHPNGKQPYTVLKGDPSTLRDAPEALLDLIKRSDVSFTTNGLDVFDNSEVTQRRFRKYLETAPVAIEGQSGDATTIVTACVGADMGLPPELTYQIMAEDWNPRCQPPWDAQGLERKVQNAYRYRQGKIGSDNAEADFAEFKEEKPKGPESDIRWTLQKGKIKKTLDNVLNVIRERTCFTASSPNEMVDNPLYDIFQFNKFSNQIEFKHQPPWQEGEFDPVVGDNDCIQFRLYMSREKGMDISKDMAWDAILAYATKYNPYHPIRDYLESLVWDGVPRLDTLLPRYAGAEDIRYNREVGKNMMLAAVGRIYNPGCKFDHILILEGKQGIGKGEFISTLASAPLRTSANFNIPAKELVDKIQGFWFIEFGELAGLRRAELEYVKDFITESVDVARPAYGRTRQKFKRQCVFIGTTNPESGVGYLKDQTGNRRYWPVYCTKCDIEALKRDRDQLFAEAVVRYKSKEKHYFTDDALIKEAEQQQLSRLEIDPWGDAIYDFIEDRRKVLREPTIITTNDIIDQCLNIPTSRTNRSERIRVTNIMRLLGYPYTRAHCPVRNRLMAGFVLPPMDVTELI